jgi:hypothetical protein
MIHSLRLTSTGGVGIPFEEYLGLKAHTNLSTVLSYVARLGYIQENASYKKVENKWTSWLEWFLRACDGEMRGTRQPDGEMCTLGASFSAAACL